MRSVLAFHSVIFRDLSTSVKSQAALSILTPLCAKHSMDLEADRLGEERDD
jgi:hypothetical protein